MSIMMRVRGRKYGEERGGEGRRGEGKAKGGERHTPILKAVAASQDLGAAGTEFERSLILSPFNNYFSFTHIFILPLLSPLRSPPSYLSPYFNFE